MLNPIIVQITGGISNGMVTLRGATGGVDCIGLVLLSGSNTPGNFLIGGPTQLNGCTRLVTNAQSGGSNLTGPVLSDMIFSP